MDEITLKEALMMVKKYPEIPPKDRDTLRRQRLYNMVTYAREHSAFYANHYANLKEFFLLGDVPPVTLHDLKKNESDWRSTDVIPNEIGTAINTERMFSNDREYRAFALRGSKTVIISATEDSQFLASWKKNTTVLSVFSPIEEIAESLNSIKPSLLWAYPTILEKLAILQKKGALNIRPILIIAGGEPLADDLRNRISAIFDCSVRNSYSSKEAGVIAYECDEGHLHINDDWVILEPLDESNRPVPAGITADKVLLTNLYKTDYPAIRMEVRDRITLYTDCQCGNISPWIIVEQSINENITFSEYGKEIIIPYEDFNTVFDSQKEILGYQLLFYAGNNLSVRLDVKSGALKPLVFLQVESKLRNFFRERGITMGAITMDEDGTLLNEDNGKFKPVLDCR